MDSPCAMAERWQGTRPSSSVVSYAEVVDILRSTAERQRIRIRGFNDMSVEEVALESGLSLLEARLAKLRETVSCFECSIPIPPLGLVSSRLFTPHAFSARRPVDAMTCWCCRRSSPGVGLLCGLYRRACGDVVSVGFAEPKHEGNLLQLVDIPVVVRERDGSIDARVTEESSAAAEVEN